jgi:hypothetical protein
VKSPLTITEIRTYRDGRVSEIKSFRR